MAETGMSVLLGEDLASLTKDPKAAEDCSQIAEEEISKARLLAEAGRTEEAVEDLLVVEKRARQASDAISVSKVVQEALKICRNAGKWQEVNDYVSLLSKKRSQLKRAIVDMVQLCMTWIDETPTKEVKLALIAGLCQVTEGKIFVEVERARLVRILATIREEEGDIDSAAQLLQEVQVETFGAMDRREKAEYILEQMRIVLAKKDFVRCQIISRKINAKLLEAEDFQDIKLKYHEYMIRYYTHELDYLNVSKCHFAIFSTASVQADSKLWQPILKAYVIYLLLAPFSYEQQDMLHKVSVLEEKKLADSPTFKRLVSEFLTIELMRWPLPYEEDLRTYSEFLPSSDEGEGRWKLLRTRVLQHNIQTLAAYYDRMHIVRVAQFLAVERDEAEAQTADLVTAGLLKAKMDRPSGIITFGGRKETSEALNDWSNDVAKILDLLEENCHLVDKEKMLEMAKAKKLQAMQKARAG